MFALKPFMAEYDSRHNLQILKLVKPITLYHLDESAAKALMIEPLRGRIAVEQQAADYLYQITSGHPYLIQFFLHQIVDTVKGEHRPSIYKEDIKQFEEVMISEGPAYDAHFKVLDSDYSVADVMEPGRARLGKGVLALIAKIGNQEKEGWVPINRIQTALTVHDCTFEDTDELLDQLLRAKILEEREINGTLCFKISIPLLRKRYVRQNLYSKYFRSLQKYVG